MAEMGIMYPSHTSLFLTNLWPIIKRVASQYKRSRQRVSVWNYGRNTIILSQRSKCDPRPVIHYSLDMVLEVLIPLFGHYRGPYVTQKLIQRKVYLRKWRDGANISRSF